MREFRGKDVVVLGIPIGGVMVALQVARALGAALDVVVTKKIGAPGEPELAVGAITQDGEVILNEVARLMGVDHAYLRSEAERLTLEVKERTKRFRGDRQPTSLKGRVAVIVDDGIATGSTVEAAIKSVRMQGPSAVIVAVPVAPSEVVAQLSREADRVVCLETPSPFYAIGEIYSNF